uniref:Uncharacterized protein n=1 Tax=Arundo donax TaxID=35708 RepID=A0A0A8Y2E9_ARUDO
MWNHRSRCLKGLQFIQK